MKCFKFAIVCLSDYLSVCEQDFFKMWLDFKMKFKERVRTLLLRTTVV